MYSADQKADLDLQVARVTVWATAQQIPVNQVATEVGPALNGQRRKFLALSRDTAVSRIVVDSAEVDDGLVRDMTEVLTSMCTRWHAKRAAANRAKRALAAAVSDDVASA